MLLKTLRCTPESSKTICILMIIYLERMIEAFEDVTINDFETSPQASPAAMTTASYLNSQQTNGADIMAPYRKETENTPKLRYIACIENEDEMRSVAKRFSSQMAQMQLRSTNWQGLIYTLLIVARKFWNDRHYWNCDLVESI